MRHSAILCRLFGVRERALAAGGRVDADELDGGGLVQIAWLGGRAGVGLGEDVQMIARSGHVAAVPAAEAAPHLIAVVVQGDEGVGAFACGRSDVDPVPVC